MRTVLLIAVLAVVASAGWFGAPAAPAQAITDCDTASAELDGTEQEMISLVNAARAQAGLGALVVSATLNRMAAWKSEDPSATGSGYPFGHTDSLGRSPFQRAVDCGYPSGAAENIAYGYPSAQTTLDAWMGSPGHRANVLNASYTAIGAGRSGSAWTLNFGFYADGGGSAPADPAPTSTPTPVPPTIPVAQPSPTATNVILPAAAPQQDSPPPTPTPSPTPRPPTPVPPAAQQLSQGLNMVTYTGPTQSIHGALLSIAGSVEWVYTWDGERWLRYVPGMPSYINTLTELRAGITYIIQLAHGANWDY